MSRDTSIPGYPELYDWPEPLSYPVRISGCGWYRDGTYYVDVEDVSGRRSCFFFDHFLGRICYGEFVTANLKMTNSLHFFDLAAALRQKHLLLSNHWLVSQKILPKLLNVWSTQKPGLIHHAT